MTATPPVIQTEGLTKRYGARRGVEELTFEVRRGEVFGFLGPNGAGKTTTMRTLLDLIRPTEGRAAIFGMDTRDGGTEIRRRTGYLPGDLELYERMTGRDLCRYLGRLRGLGRVAEVATVAERLDAELDARIGNLSKGNRQKIGLIQAFMHRPELLILDEPTSGLDPLVQHQVHGMIRETAEDGRTVFLSSHILPEVEGLCDRVGIIREGRLVAVEQIAALKRRAIRRLEIHFDGPIAVREFERLSGVRDVSTVDHVLLCTVVGSLDEVVKAAARHTVVNVVTHEPSLEEIFLAYYGGEDAP
jgi:ABC-2 type transport system ATP-binding protein